MPDGSEQVGAHIRWQILRDYPEVLAIENASFQFPWLKEEFLRVLRQRNCIGMVAEHDEKIVGYMIYELHRNKIQVLDFAVHPLWCRKSIGRQMVAKLVGKLSSQRRNRISLLIRETNLAGHLFFRAMGFLATAVVREHFTDSGEDAYAMSYHLDESVLPDFLKMDRLQKENA
jgi:[ribosomal protein S18]-alanine N-acetyltransferase